MTTTSTTGRGPCPSCGVYPDEEHHDWCDVARCLVTGLQRSGCPGRHDCGRDLWSGLWPGEAECAEYGFLYGAGFPDLNRLYLEAHWDPGLRRWVRDPGPRPDGAAG